MVVVFILNQTGAHGRGFKRLFGSLSKPLAPKGLGGEIRSYGRVAVRRDSTRPTGLGSRPASSMASSTRCSFMMTRERR